MFRRERLRDQLAAAEIPDEGEGRQASTPLQAKGRLRMKAALGQLDRLLDAYVRHWYSETLRNEVKSLLKKVNRLITV